MDDIEELLQDSLEALHRQNTRRPIHCRHCPELTFLTLDGLREHRARFHTHPSVGAYRG